MSGIGGVAFATPLTVHVAEGLAAWAGPASASAPSDRMVPANASERLSPSIRGPGQRLQVRDPGVSGSGVQHPCGTTAEPVVPAVIRSCVAPAITHTDAGLVAPALSVTFTGGPTLTTVVPHGDMSVESTVQVGATPGDPAVSISS